MKKKYWSILIITCILSLGVLTACQRGSSFQFNKNDADSISVYTYDFEKNQTTSNWVYQDEDGERLVNYLHSLKGKQVEKIEIDDLGQVFYGVYLHMDPVVRILFTENYAISSTGEYYLIRGEKEDFEM